MFLRQPIRPHPSRAAAVRHYADNMPNLRLALFPDWPNSKYCDRYNDKTKLYCNPRFNAEKHLGRKSPRDVALNIQRKTETAYEKGLTDCAHYFERLGSFVLDGLGPAYQANDLISDELYRTWLSIVNQPNCRAKIKRPDRLEYPYPVLWYGFVRDGNRYVQVEFPGAEYPTLFECLSQLAESPQSKCTLDYKGQVSIHTAHGM